MAPVSDTYVIDPELLVTPQSLLLVKCFVFSNVFRYPDKLPTGQKPI